MKKKHFCRPKINFEPFLETKIENKICSNFFFENKFLKMRKTSILAQNGPFWPVLRKKGHFLNFFETKNFNFNYTNHISTKKCNIKRFQAIIWSKSSKNPFSMFFHTQIDPILASFTQKGTLFDFFRDQKFQLQLY